MSGRSYILLFIVLFSGCSSRGPDPRSLIPVDSDAWMAVRSAREMAPRLSPIVEQYPEYGGFVDLVRSVMGIDMARPDRESGIDPGRGVATAWWRGGLLIILPVSEPGLAARRLSLRLARFGFVQQPGKEKLKSFESGERGHACFQITSGVAAVFVGPKETCSILPGIADSADDSAESVARLDVDTVGVEMGMDGADIVFRVGNQLFAPDLLRRAGIAPTSAAGYMAAGMMGDLRGALKIDRTISLRAAIGPSFVKFDRSEAPLAVDRPAVEAVEVDLTIGPSVRPLLDSLVSLCGRRCKSRGIDMLFGSWDGRMRLTVPSVMEGGSTRRGLIDSLLAVTSRVTVTGLAGIRRSGPEIMNFVRKRLQQSALVVESDGPLTFSFEGYDVAVAGSDSLMAVASGPSALAAVSRAMAAAPDDGLPEMPRDGRIASVRISPEGVLELSGLGFLDYLRRLVNPVRLAGVDVYYQEGRIVVDGRVEIR